MEKPTEEERVELGEQVSKETANDDEGRNPEGHEPLPGLVGDRIKEASEPERTS